MEHYTPDTIDIMYEYVRQSGLYNMCFPIEEARRAFAAILAVGVYLGQPLDWAYLTATPHWPSRVQNAYSRYPGFPRLVREAADALPGGTVFLARVKSNKDVFAAPTPRMRLTQREIVQEAVTECLNWANGNDKDDYKAIVRGAQILEDERKLRPPPDKISLGTYYL